MYNLNGRNIKDIVVREDWQALRKEFLGTWKSQPERNVKKLRCWLGDIGKTEDDKLIIVLNYLTGSGFRSGNISHYEIDKLRMQVKRELRTRGIIK